MIKKLSIKAGIISVLSMLMFVCCFMTIGFTGVKANTNEITMKDGASIRYKETEEVDLSGIRFSAYVSEDYISNNPNAEYGMLIIPADLLGANELTEKTPNVLKKPTKYWLEESDLQGYAQFNTVLYNIPTNEYGRGIAARAYVNDGTNYLYSDITVKRSLAEVASIALSKGDTKVAELNGYIDNAVTVFEAEDIVVEKGKTEKLSVQIEPAELVAVYESSNDQIVTVDNNGNVTGVNSGVANVTITLGAKQKTVKVTVKEVLDSLSLSKYVIKGEELDLAEMGVESLVGATNYEVTGVSPASTAVEVNGTSFVPTESGKYVFNVNLLENNEVVITQEVEITVTIFDDNKALYKDVLLYNDNASLDYVSSSRETKIVADDTAEGGYALETGYDSINNVVKPLTIDLGGNYKLSEILAIKISYKIIYAGGNRWATVAVNSKEKVISWHYTMRSSTNDEYTGQAQVMDDYVDVVITQERLKGSDANNPILNDEYIQSLLFFDGSNGATATVYTTVRIASIEVVTKPTAQEMNNLLKFNSEDSLDLITNVRGRSIVADEKAEGGYALEASFDYINYSGNWLAINLGSNYKLSEISSIKISYKVVYGNEKIWTGVGVNGRDTLIDWWKIMKESTGDKYTNQNVVMDDYVDVVITQERLKGMSSSPQLSDDTLISSLVFFDSSNRTDETYRTTVRIASIKIERNLTLEEKLLFNSEESLSLVSTSYQQASLVKDETAEGGYALEASFCYVKDVGRYNLTLDLGGAYQLSEIQSIKISYKVVYGNEKIWYGVGINGSTARMDWYKIMKEFTNNNYSNQNKIMDDYADVVITQEYLKCGSNNTSVLADDTLISSLVLFDPNGGLRADLTWITTVRIASIEIVLV